jgi:hypothetical protein
MFKFRNAAMHRYVRRVAAASLAYLVTLWLAVHFVGHDRVSGPVAYLLALLPGISVVGYFWAIGKLLIEEDDEYRRMLFVRQALFASGFTLSIATVWGFLENFHLVAHVDGYFAAILWFVGTGLGALWNKVRGA